MGEVRDCWLSGVDSSSVLSFQSGNIKEAGGGGRRGTGLVENTRSGVAGKCLNHLEPNVFKETEHACCLWSGLCKFAASAKNP